MSALGTFWETVNESGRKEDNLEKEKGEKEGGMEGREGIRKTV